MLKFIYYFTVFCELRSRVEAEYFKLTNFLNNPWFRGLSLGRNNETICSFAILGYM